MRKNIVFIGLGVLLGLGLTRLDLQVLKASADERYSDLQNFSKVLNLVQEYYVEPVDTKKLIQGAIRGVLRELDPHTNYLPPDVFKDFENETSGEFGGLGIEISVQNGILTIISPIEDTPAWAAGIQAGDKVVAVDGKSTKGLSLVDASQLMRGKKGTRTVLSIVREGSESPMDIPIVRGNVKVRSVKYTDLDEGYSYVRITSFIENTVIDLEKVLNTHLKKHGKISGLILDLRRNPGGLLDQAVRMSDLFIEDGVIVSTIGRDAEKKEVTRATKRAPYKDFPVIVLVNEYSASASEIVAGALQDNKRAIILGQKTFGKGSVQSVIKLGDGSGLKLTVARYFTPSGRSIQAEGILPDIELEELSAETFKNAVVKERATREKDIQGHLLGDKEKADKAKSQENVEAWWKAASESKPGKLSPKDQLLTSDFVAFQAFNYVKAFRLMKDIQNKSTQ